MPDMYDKLGEMLNEALESGKIPENNKEPDEPVVEPVETTGSSGSFTLNNDGLDKLNHRILKKKQQIPTGEVIKMHKYTYNMQFPPQIQSALTTLDIAYPFTTKDITSAYHNKLKQIHPDIQNTIQTSKDVQNNRHLTVDEVRNSYKILCDFFEIK